MSLFTTVKLRASAHTPCPLGGGFCGELYHSFEVTQNAQKPLSAEDEKEIRTKLQAQLDLLIAKFLEAHK